MVIRAGWMIDGTGGPIKENAILMIENGCIDRIGESLPSAINRSEILDLSGCTVFPGLVDCHVHLSMSGDTDADKREHQLKAEFEDARRTIAYHLNRHFSYGVLAVRDGGDQNGHTLRYIRKCLNEKRSHVRIKASGKAWHKPGRYGRFIGRTPQNGDTLHRAIEKDGDHKRIDHIKIINSGLNSLKIFGKETEPQFGPREMKEAVQTAKRLGLKTMVHANGKIPVQIAVEAGCDSIEHGFFMGRENLARMADRGVAWVPTACTMKACSDFFKTGPESEVSKKMLDHQLEQLSLARDLGVTVAVGTDSGSPGVHHGRSVIDEIGLLMTAGYTVREAAACATLNGAKLLGIENRGALASGKKASFIAVNGGPSRFPDSLKRKRIQAVHIDSNNPMGKS